MIPNAPTIMGTTLIFMFYSFLSSWHFFNLPIYFIFIAWHSCIDDLASPFLQLFTNMSSDFCIGCSDWAAPQCIRVYYSFFFWKFFFLFLLLLSLLSLYASCICMFTLDVDNLNKSKSFQISNSFLSIPACTCKTPWSRHFQHFLKFLINIISLLIFVAPNSPSFSIIISTDGLIIFSIFHFLLVPN